MPWWLAGMPPKTDKSKRQVCRSALHLHFAAWYFDCQLKFWIAPASNYSKQIDIVPIVNISVRFVRQIIK